MEDRSVGICGAWMQLGLKNALNLVAFAYQAESSLLLRLLESRMGNL